MPQKTVLALAQDRSGYIWIGLNEGLLRFDGSGFLSFEKRNEPAFHDDRVRSLCSAKDGSLWIGTVSGGMVRNSNGRFKHYGTAEGLSGDRIKAIAEGVNGAIWIATDRGLNLFENNAIATVPWQREEEILALHAGRDGTLWIGTSRGLRKMQPGKTPVDFIAAPGMISAIAENPADGTLWVAAADSVYEIKGESVKRFTGDNGIPASVVTTLMLDSHGTLWLGTEGSGLSRYQNGVFETYDAKNELYQSRIHALLEDQEGSLWTGDDTGLNRLRDARVMMIDAEDGLENVNSWGVLVDSRKNIWIGTEQGVAVSRFGGHLFAVDSRFPAVAARALLEDRAGNIWVGTETNGIFCASATDVRHVPVDFAVRSFRQDESGIVWAGGAGGQLVTFTHNRAEPSILKQNPWHNSAVADLAFDSSGAIFVATDGSGLWKKSGGQWTQCGTRDGLANESLNVLFVDGSGEVWIGTRENGLYLWSQDRVTHLAPDKGLPANSVLQLISDVSGNIWVGTERGIFRAKISELKEAAAGKKGCIKWLSFGTRDGMKNRSTSAGHPCSRSPDGFLWFPTPEGVAIINPNVLPTNTAAPQVWLQELIANDLSFNNFSNLEFGSQTRRLEFRYAALSFIEPHAIQYRYRLEGLDERWFNARDRGTAVYYNVPAGKYTFRVLAANSDGVWNRKGAAVSFTITPPVEQAWWFRVVIGIALAAAFLLLHRMRLRRLLGRQKRLEFQLKQTERDLRNARREMAHGKEGEAGAPRVP